MTFLPDKYKVPENPSQYMRLEEGKNIIRILSSAIIGWEYWTEDKEGNRKPIRVKTLDEVPEEVRKTKDPRERAKHFWAFTIYNLNLEEVQILEITQKTIMRLVKSLVDDETWGDPKNYNITINKEKTGSRDMDVEYSVMPQPKKELDKGILEYYEAMNVSLEALFEGKDPFNVDEGEKLAEEVAEKI